MRNLCTLPVSLSVLVCLLTCSAQAGTSVQCLENALPIEILGDDAEQRDTLLSQAEACMREAKPLRAVALLSQLIKTNPTDASTYINRDSAYSAAGDLGAAISDFILALLIGIVSGTYSSIFVASPLIVDWHLWEDRRRGRLTATRSPRVRRTAT